MKFLIKKALFSAFFYCIALTSTYAHDRILEDLSPQVKSYVVLKYYDLKREAVLAKPKMLDEVLLELNCKYGQFNKSDFLSQFSQTNGPIEAVRLIEKIELLCSE
jgi:hypothetical protein